MDNKAKKILFHTYWSGKGWKEGADRYTSPEDFAYAKEKGLMFDPITISHDECVKRVVNLANNITIEQVAKAFLCSLSTRRLDWRSAVSSYYIAKLFTVHKYTPVESFFLDSSVSFLISLLTISAARSEVKRSQLVFEEFRKR